MKRLLRTNAILIGSLVLCAECFAQTDPKNLPQPPTAELRKFDPFLGKYEVSGDFANLRWKGTLELKRVIKGWYIQQTILIKSEGIDREFWVLATWDNKAQKYRLWGFQTLPNALEGDIRFDADEMITEWPGVAPDGSKTLSRNTYRFISTDQLEITSYRQVGDGSAEKIGFLHGKRISDSVMPLTSEPRNPSLLQAPAANTTQPSPEMQRILNSQVGTWSLRLARPDGTSGEGIAIWRPGPGAKSLIEDENMKDSKGEMSGLSVTWWDDTAKGYRGLWCSNKSKNGCLVMSKLAHWQGDQFVLGDEFEQNGKKITYKEVESEITPTTYTLNSYLGEFGSDLRLESTIHATKIAKGAPESSNTAAEAELRDAMAERLKAAIEGDTEKTASFLADEYTQTDIGGYVQDKTTWLNEYFRPLAELIKARKFRWEVYDRKDVQIHMYGDCAVVIGMLEAKGSGAKYAPALHTWVADPNASFSGTLRFTHVNIKRNGRWLLAALHNQLLPSPPPSEATK